MESGRWLSRDPISENGGINLYGFIGNRPILRWDNLGLDEGYGGFAAGFGFGGQGDLGGSGAGGGAGGCCGGTSGGSGGGGSPGSGAGSCSLKCCGNDELPPGWKCCKGKRYNPATSCCCNDEAASIEAIINARASMVKAAQSEYARQSKEGNYNISTECGARAEELARAINPLNGGYWEVVVVRTSPLNWFQRGARQIMNLFGAEYQTQHHFVQVRSLCRWGDCPYSGTQFMLDTYGAGELTGAKTWPKGYNILIRNHITD